MGKTAWTIGVALILGTADACSSSNTAGNQTTKSGGGHSTSSGGAGAGTNGAAGNGSNSTGPNTLLGKFASLEDALKAIAELDAPTPKPAQQSACTDCLAPDPNKMQGEYSCGYNLDQRTDVQSDDLVMLGPDDDLWPGNVLSGRDAASGQLNAVALPLGPLTVSSTLAGAGQSARIDSPSRSTYMDALAKLLPGATKPTGTAVASKIEVSAVYGTEDLSRLVGVSTSSPTLLPISGSLQIEKRSDRMTQSARVAVSLVQSYFKVAMDPHTSPSDYFAPSVTPDRLQATLANGDPPVYVRSVTYGRRIVAVFEDTTTESSDMLEAQVKAAFPAGSASGDLQVDQSASSISASFRAVALGDSHVFTSVTQLLDYLTTETPDVQTSWPIAYTLEYVRDNSPFKVGVTTEVVSRDCKSCIMDDASEGTAEGFANAIDGGTHTDNDSDGWMPPSALILSADDVDWYRYSGTDTVTGVVDPEATLTTTATGTKLCMYIACASGAVASFSCGAGQMNGSMASMPGCCGATHASIVGLDCAITTTENATVYVRVDGSGIGDLTCQSYDLKMHY